MDFDFSDEQKVIRDEARKLLAAQCDLKRVRRVLEGETSFDRELWQTIAEAGWIGSAIGEEYGGLGLGRVTLCVIAEELGRALAPVPVPASIYLAAEALALSNNEALAAELLPRLASGELIGTLALTEGVKPLHALEAIETKVIDGRLTGSKLPVLFGHIADFALVAAKSAAGVVGLYRIDLNAQGVERMLLDSIDPTLPLARIEFKQVACTLLIEDATELLPKLLDRAAVFLAFEQIGAASAALEMSCDYARIRQAFGRPIGSFQAIKHKLAEMYTKIEIARSNAFYAAWALEADAPELALAAAAARLAATDAFEWTAKETIQTHGGIGATWEADPHLFYRRSRALASLLDTSLAWRDRLVHELELHFAA